MGLIDTIQKAAQSAIQGIGDLAPICSYYEQGKSERDKLTREVTSQDTVYEVRALVTDYTTAELKNSAIKSTDQKILIASNDLAIVPKKKDYLIDSDGITWSFEAINTDPASALWIIQGRS